ncbi:major facilitator superfamily domain-containing protein [Aspergillus desertorum]
MPAVPAIPAKRSALPDREQYTVDFEGPDDRLHPHNWPLATKLIPSVLACSGTFIASLNSAMFSPAIDEASRDCNVGTEVITLGTALFVRGFATGPMIWAPMSELLGRKLPLAVAIFSQLTVVPGVLADLYNNTYHGIAIALYALTVFGGPFVAPIAGGLTASSSLGWRWTLYIPAILALAIGALSIIFLKETYPPCILIAKASCIRRRSGNWAIHAKQEELELESFIYGLVYALLQAYPYVFEHIHGLTPGYAGLTFIGLIIGIVLALCFILSQQAQYSRKLRENGNVPVPEWRLRPTMSGAPVFTLGLFCFGWTGLTSRIHWAAPAAAGIPIGFGFLCIFLPCFNYLADAYLPVAASAVAANIILRSAFASGFPLFTRQMTWKAFPL